MGEAAATAAVDAPPSARRKWRRGSPLSLVSRFMRPSLEIEPRPGRPACVSCPAARNRLSSIVSDASAAHPPRLRAPDVPSFNAASSGRLRVHRERFGLDRHKQAADAADRAVEPRELRGLEVGEEARRPGFEMPLEEAPLGARLRRELAAGQPRHDLAQDRHMILGLALALGGLDAETLQILPDAGQRTLVEEA